MVTDCGSIFNFLLCSADTFQETVLCRAVFISYIINVLMHVLLRLCSALRIGTVPTTCLV